MMGDKRQLHIDRQHNPEGSDERHDRNEKVLRSVVGKLPDVHKVIRDAAHNISGLRVIKETKGLPLHVQKQVSAQVCFNVDAQFMSPVIDDKLHA